METAREAFVALRRARAGSLRPWEPRMGDIEQQFGDQFFDRLLGRRESASDGPFLIHRASDDEIVGYVGLGQIFRARSGVTSWASGSAIRTWAGATAHPACGHAWRWLLHPKPPVGSGSTGSRRTSFPPTTRPCSRQAPRDAKRGVQPPVSRDRRRGAEPCAVGDHRRGLRRCSAAPIVDEVEHAMRT